MTESPHAMALWDSDKNEEAGLHLDKLTWGSNKKVNWLCQCCPKGQLRRWTAVDYSVALTKSGCPCCVGHRACECNSLQSLYPVIAAQWDYSKNIGAPADYPASSYKKVWWRDSKSWAVSYNQATNVLFTRKHKASFL